MPPLRPQPPATAAVDPRQVLSSFRLQTCSYDCTGLSLEKMSSVERPTGSSHMAFTMAALVAAGGASGYARSGSVPSLVAGLGIAALFGAGGWQINVSLRAPARAHTQPCVAPTPHRPFAFQQPLHHESHATSHMPLAIPPLLCLPTERAARCGPPAQSGGFAGAAGCHGAALCQDAKGAEPGALLARPGLQLSP